MTSGRLPAFFRKTNANLLYPGILPVEKVRKLIFYLSVRCYRQWMKKSHDAQTVTLHDIDKDITMQVDISKSMGASFFWTGFHELNEWRFLHKYLTPEMTFFDIGSNQGEYALFAGKRLTRGRVLAFEPVDFFFDLLNRNITLNNFHNIQTFHYGLSDKDIQVPIYREEKGTEANEGLASIFQSERRTQFLQNIDLRTLDGVMPSFNLTRIDFMKVDVEGAEMMVLQGARKTIQQYKPLIMMEISKNNYDAAGYTIDDVLNFFSALGYSLRTITKKGTLEAPAMLPDFCNAIFVPNKTL